MRSEASSASERKQSETGLRETVNERRVSARRELGLLIAKSCAVAVVVERLLLRGFRGVKRDGSSGHGL